jgi:hypothetical protein
MIQVQSLLLPLQLQFPKRLPMPFSPQQKKRMMIIQIIELLLHIRFLPPNFVYSLFYAAVCKYCQSQKIMLIKIISAFLTEIKDYISLAMVLEMFIRVSTAFSIDSTHIYS